MSSRSLFLVALAAAIGLPIPARAVDHNNIDSGRPLRFDDAESIAFREQAFELGLRLGWPRSRPLGLGLQAEYLYGFAMNTHLDFVFARPTVGGIPGQPDNRFDYGDVSFGVLHNFNRETERTPAFSVRADVFAPTGRQDTGTAARLRGIMSRAIDQYGRLHVNVDLTTRPSPPPGARAVNPALIVGYTRPLGYPRRFDRTGLVDMTVQWPSDRGEGPLVSLGAGLRQQVGLRSVVDIGLQADVIGFNRVGRDRLRLIAGYSYGF